MTDAAKAFMALIPQMQEVNAMELMGSWPLMGGSGGPALEFTVVENEPHPLEGDVRHAFGSGWQVFYGGDWVPKATWVKLKIAGL
jgi:hypothetical protein